MSNENDISKIREEEELRGDGQNILRKRKGGNA
jgi:hypothetical protein